MIKSRVNRAAGAREQMRLINNGRWKLGPASKQAGSTAMDFFTPIVQQTRQAVAEDPKYEGKGDLFFTKVNWFESFYDERYAVCRRTSTSYSESSSYNPFVLL